MKSFLGDNFLLSNQVAEELYHDYAKDLPIIDYHNHLDPESIASNLRFTNITEAWLQGDHYKWRAMRANGIAEEYITGGASDEEKFMKWAATVPFTLRNPLYHWTHLELKRYFGISDLLNSETAKEIYAETSRQLRSDSHSVVGLLKQMKVKALCTTDDPIDDLRYHKQMSSQQNDLRVFPTFRPDKVLNFDQQKATRTYLDQLGATAQVTINGLDSLLEALQNRVGHFHELGCRVADHGLSQLPMMRKTVSGLESTFQKWLAGSELSLVEVEDLQGYVLSQLCKMYYAKGWVQQFHLGALRNNNDRAMRELGPDTGYDSMGDFDHGLRMSRFFNHLDSSDQLAKTVVYNLNPRDNDLFTTMVGNFNDGKIAGKMQFGASWWFLDQKSGIEDQLNSLSNMGLLSRFIGMLTDSRSFLSFPRHEYFRRILCNLIGTDVVNGELPHDMNMLGAVVKNISYNNTKEYFGLA